MEKEIIIKGNKDGLYLNVKKGLDYDTFFKAFKKTIEEYISFFSGGNIVGINNIFFSDEQKKEILDYISEIEGIKISSFEKINSSSEKPKTKKTSEKKENKPDFFEKIIEKRTKIDINPYMGVEKKMDETVFYRGTVRSGTKIVSKSHIMIIGDVNPGAELIADGNIVVMGILRGLAHAGADGSSDKVIVAWKLKPTQIRIADYITLPPDDEDEDINYPEMAVVESGRIIIKSYQ